MLYLESLSLVPSTQQLFLSVGNFPVSTRVNFQQRALFLLSWKMQLLWGLLALSLLLGSSAGRKQLPPGLDPRSYWIQGPGDHFTPHFFEWVGSNPDLVSNIFFKHIPRDGRSSALDSFSPPESRDETCNGCIVSTNLPSAQRICLSQVSVQFNTIVVCALHSWRWS